LFNNLTWLIAILWISFQLENIQMNKMGLKVYE
jgi:hypothetical protein